MAIYDINGNEIPTGGELATEDVKKALISAVASGDVSLGGSVGATLGYTSPGTAWETNAETAYNNLLTAYKAISHDGVPFFISTDQHGKGVECMRWLNNKDADINGMGVMSLNLGDTCHSDMDETILSSLYNRSWQVKNYIGIPGNHDASNGNYYDLSRWFVSTRGRRFCNGSMMCYAVEDDAHAVKYIAVANYILTEGSLEKGLDSDAAEWLVNELAKNDGYDVIYLQHWPVFTTKRLRDAKEETADSENHSASYNYAIWQMLRARKDKQSGMFKDSYGGEHAYDFTNCDTDLLITLHGHNHQEQISTVDGLTAYAADWYNNNNCCTFGLVDRKNSKVTFWVFNNNGCLDPLELPI